MINKTSWIYMFVILNTVILYIKCTCIKLNKLNWAKWVIWWGISVLVTHLLVLHCHWRCHRRHGRYMVPKIFSCSPQPFAPENNFKHVKISPNLTISAWKCQIVVLKCASFAPVPPKSCPLRCTPPPQKNDVNCCFQHCLLKNPVKIVVGYTGMMFEKA